MIAPRPLRSLLFVPGNRERWVEPAIASGTDGIVFDLQDSVPRPELADARNVVKQVLDRGLQSPQLFVRVSTAHSHDIIEDLEAVVRPGLSGVVVPDVRGPDDVVKVARYLDALESQNQLAVDSVIIMPLLESAEAVRNSYEIATASERVAHMGGGTASEGDLARNIGFRWTPEGQETLMLRSQVLMNVRAARVRYPISGTWGLIDDLDGLEQFAISTKNLGYEGMMAIHPAQVSTINRVFSPSTDDIGRWRETIVAMKEASTRGIGAVRVRGRLVDEAHVKSAEAGLRYAEQLGLADGTTTSSEEL